MNRGEVWTYEPIINRPGVSTRRLIISAAPINENPHLKVVLTLHILESDPGGLLAVEIGSHGWASALHPEATVRRRLNECVGVADAEMMDRVSAALRAAQDL
ncbi:type II toxin-antitoxin system PemK/MazF family toxin [Nocardia iowensis]|uniref:Type II toxin-antitoxin system PemK/MazF family toxin n=1 Tax=Nocardia iowensis TaxID=204891 RepID=A0ABX8RJA6_NOCIO|nr:type II toxin-antitoxin system PemK/MazF family toxin [Nocardia iowensis]QXN89067.1 type II toxin-antitoxin system PemK/MazF family toxin [Nocardia iowensis]